MLVEAAIGDALRAGKCLCKFISPNEVGDTGSHQYGFYLPKAAWQMYAAFAPTKGRNREAMVQISWPTGIKTKSCVKWYGIGTRSEYRLTRFGRNFPWLTSPFVGALFILIPISYETFIAHVLDTDDEIELFQVALGLDVLDEWAVFNRGKPAALEQESEILNRKYAERAAEVDDFPSGREMADWAREAVEIGSGVPARNDADDRLLRWVEAEYGLFRTIEAKLCAGRILGPFADVDRFINVAATIMNRRKSRAGHSLEYHVEHLLQLSGVPFDSQPRIDGKVKPDILIPGKRAYEDTAFPSERLTVLALKTTCKDRWRQVLNEGRRVPEKHLLTLQPSISRDQLIEMREARIRLVVPKRFHKGYIGETGVALMTVEEFLQKQRGLFS